MGSGIVHLGLSPKQPAACRKLARTASWAWYPSHCSLQTFNAQKLSRKLAGRQVLFIGDSLTVQQFRGLSRLMCRTWEECVLSPKFDPEPAFEHFYTIHHALFQLEVCTPPMHCSDV